MAFLRFFFEELMPTSLADKGELISNRRFCYNVSESKKLEVLLTLSYDISAGTYAWKMTVVEGQEWMELDLACIGVSVDGLEHARDEYGVHDMFDPFTEYYYAEGPVSRHPALFAKGQGCRKVCFTLVLDFLSVDMEDKDVNMFMQPLETLCMQSLKQHVTSQTALEVFVSAHLNRASVAEWIQLSASDPPRFHKCLEKNILRGRLSFEASQHEFEPDAEEVFMELLRAHYESDR